MKPRAPHPLAEQIAAEACDWIARRDAGLSPGEQIEFESWRNADPRHASALAQFGAAWSAVERPRRTGSTALLGRELRRLERRRQLRRLGATAGVAAVAVLAGFVWRSRPTPAAAVQREIARAVLLVPERRTLPDGSVLEFPAGTEFALELTPRLRRVLLKRGNAHFMIATDAARPFVVAAAGIEIRAVGTAFAVQMEPQAVEILVTEGRVEVTPGKETNPGFDRPPAADEQARPADLATVDRPLTPSVIPVASGNRIVMNRSTAGPSANRSPEVQKVDDAEIARRLAWRSPQVEFSGAPLSEVVALLNRHNQLQFVIADPALESVPLSGLFRATDTDAFLRILEVAFGVKSERHDNQIILRKVR